MAKGYSGRWVLCLIKAITQWAQDPDWPEPVLGPPVEAVPVAVLLAYVTSYDLRGAGIETSKGDKQGLGLTERNKKRFETQ